MSDAVATAANVSDLIARLKANPADTETYERLVAHFEAAQDWAALVSLMAGWARRRPDATEAAEGLRRAAGIALTKLGDPGRATQLCERALQRAGRGEARGRVLLDLARIKAEQLGDLDGAIDALREARKLLPRAIDASHLLATYLARKCEGLAPHEAARHHPELANLMFDIAIAVSDSDSLVFAEAALGYNPGHDDALAIVERLAERCDAAGRLPGHWANYLAHAEDGPSTDRRRVQLARVYADAGQREEAERCLQPAARRGVAEATELMAQLQPEPHATRGHAEPAGPPPSPTHIEAPPPQAPAPSAPPPEPAANVFEQDAVFAPPSETAPTQTDRGRLGTLHRELRTLVAERRHEEAAERAREILRLDPVDALALNFLDTHYRRTQDYRNLCALLRQLGHTEQLPLATRKLRFLEAASLWERKLDDADQAARLLREAVSLDPRDRKSLDAYKRLLKRMQRWDELADVMEQELAIAEDDKQHKELLKQLAALHRQKREDPSAAAGALERLHALEPDDIRVRDLLCDHWLTLERYAEAVPLLQQRIEETHDRPQKLKWMRTLASALADHLDDAEQACRVYEQILELAPRDREALDHIERLGERAGFGPERLLALLEQRLASTEDKNETAELERRIAHVRADQLGDIQGAREAWQRVLAIKEDREALEFLETQAREDEDYEALGDLLKRRAALATDKAERRDLRFERAQVLAQLGRPQQALTELRALLKRLDPDYEPALEQLVQLARQIEDYETAASALQQLSTKTEDPTRRAELARELADLVEDKIANPRRALQVLTLWSELEPASPEPLRRQLPYWEKLGKWPELIATLDRLNDLQPEVPEHAYRAAELSLRRLRDVDAAWQRLLPLFELGDAQAEQLLVRIADEHGRQDQLCALLEQHGRYEALVDVLQARINAEKNDDARVELLRWVAHVMTEQLDDENGAAEAWHSVLGVRDDPEGLSFMRDLATRRQDPELLASTLQRLARHAQDKATARDLELERAELLLGPLDRPEEAIDVLRAILSQLDPHCDPAIDALISAGESADAPEALAEGLEHKLRHSEEPEDRMVVAERLSDLYMNTLEDERKAAGALLAWSEADLANPLPLRRLRPLFEKAQRWDELVRVLDGLAECEDEREERHAASLAAAEILCSRLNRIDDAWHRLATVFQDGNDAAEQSLRDLAQRSGKHDDLIGLYVGRAQAASSPEASAQYFQRVADIYETWKGEPAQALEASLRVLATDLDNPRYRAEVDRLAIQSKAWKRWLQVYGRLFDRASDDRERVALLVHVADLLDREARDPEGALERMIAVTKLEPDNVQWLERTEALARRAAAHEALIDAFKQHAQLAEEDATRVALLLEAAKTSDEGLEDRDQANALLDEALELARETPELADRVDDAARAIEGARPVLGERNALRSLLFAYTRLAQQAPRPTAIALFERAASVAQHDLEDARAAFDILRRASASYPDEASIEDALRDIAQKTNLLDALEAHWAQLVERVDDELRSHVLEKRARLLDEALDRPARAADTYTKLLELNPQDSTVAIRLLSCQKRAGNCQGVLRTIAEQLGRTGDRDTKLTLLREAADVWEHELRNRWEALDVWKQIAELDPDATDAQEAISRLERTSIPPTVHR